MVWPPAGQTTDLCRYGVQSVRETASEEAFLNSIAQVWIAPSSCRKLLIQAPFCAVARALTKLGMAMAASIPMMATTIMISTSVNPDLRDIVVFITDLSFKCGVNEQQAGY